MQPYLVETFSQRNMMIHSEESNEPFPNKLSRRQNQPNQYYRNQLDWPDTENDGVTL